MNYTIQKNIEFRGSGPDSYTQNGTSIAMDTYNLSREKSVAPIDVPQTFTASGGYALPFGQGRRWSSKGVAGKIIGDWQLNGIVTLRGGFPTDIRTNVIPPIFNTFNVPDSVPGQPLLLPNAGVNGYFNPNAWTVPGTVPSVTGAPIQLYGTAAQRAARGPGSRNLGLVRSSAISNSRSGQVPGASTRVIQRHQHADILPARRQQHRADLPGESGDCV